MRASAYLITKTWLLAVTLLPGLNAVALGAPRSTSPAIAFLVKTGGTAEARSADQARCREIANKADIADLPQKIEPNSAMGTGVGAIAAGMTGIVGLLIGEAIGDSISEGKARRLGADLCMVNLGYRTVPLTPAESATYASLSPPKQKTWERNFQPADLQARLTPALVPFLPAYDDDTALTGCSSIRISDLALAAPEIREQGVVVTGAAMRRRTAVLVTPIETSQGAVRLAADPGTVFHLVDYRPQKEPLLRDAAATWCATMRQMAAGNVAKDFYCFTGRDNGYEVYRPSGEPWLAGPYTDGFILPIYDRPIQLKEREKDDLGPMKLELKVAKVEDAAVMIAAEAKHDGRSVRLWLRRIPFAKDGTAVLPLWDAKLVMIKLPNHALKAELTHDGDGSSWRVGTLSRTLYPDLPRP